MRCTTRILVAMGAQIGKYQLVQHLASGGMARVYLARVIGPGGFERHVVLKTLRTTGEADPSLVPMFLDEARVAAALHHRNIAQVFDVGSEGGTYFLAMEYVHGETLRAVMEAAFARDVKLPLAFGVTVICAAASALHHAHERRGARGVPLGIVHRDVAPSNLMLSYDGSVKLIDFGIAKVAERACHTQIGFIKGKTGYMAPEQLRGDPVDRRTDVFALGVLAYEVTTLRRAFPGDTQYDALENTVRSDAWLPTKVVPGFPPELEAVILTAVERDPNDRYPSADVMRRDLERAAARLGVAVGEEAVRPVLEQLFGLRPEPWMRAAGPRGSDPAGDRAHARGTGANPAHAPLVTRVRGTAANRALADEEEITSVFGEDGGEERTTAQRDSVAPVPQVAPVVCVLPLRPPAIETPLPRLLATAADASDPAGPDESSASRVEIRGPWVPTRRTRRWTRVSQGVLLTASVIAACIAAGRAGLLAPLASLPRAPRQLPAPIPTAPRPPPPPLAAPTPTAPAAAARTEITLHVTTDPPGATVVLDGVRLGKTPFTGTVPSRSGPVWLKVRHRGRVARTRVSLERDLTWSVELRRRRVVAPPSDEPEARER